MEKQGAAQASAARPGERVGPTDGAKAEGGQQDSAVADPPTTVMRVVRAGSEPVSDEVPGSEDKTVAMRVVPNPAEAQTMALPIQVPPNEDVTQRVRTSDAPKAGGTDRVSGTPLSKPPHTPRPASGPKQPGQGQHGPTETEETRPSPPRPPAQRPPVATAPSPADVQPTMPAQPLAGPRPPQPRAIAQPQRIEPAGKADTPAAPAAKGSKRWLLAVGAAAVLVVALVAAIVAFITTRGDNSPEAQVRGVITDYTEALKKGDLATLRSSTCGPLHDYYQSVPADQFAEVHRLTMERKNVPVVDTIEAIRITDGTAIAQATVYTEADPAKRSARTFDLQRTDSGWKVCDPPMGAS